jgi:hypothetical protein
MTALRGCFDRIAFVAKRRRGLPFEERSHTGLAEPMAFSVARSGAA